MLKRKILGGLTIVLPWFGLGCQATQQQSCCSPCQCQAAPAAPCGTNSCCSSNERRPLFAAKRKGECCETASPCAKPACDCGCGSAAPAKQPTPAPAPAPTSNLKRTQFNPFGVTEPSGVINANCDPCSKGPVIPAGLAPMNPTIQPRRVTFNPFAVTEPGQIDGSGEGAIKNAAAIQRPAFNPFAVTETSQSSAPCDCSNGSATQPASSMMPSRAPFNPLAITDSGGPVVASHQPAQLPSSMPTSYYHNDDYTMLVGELHYNPRTDTWRLRYATVDVVDLFGGSVTLADAGSMLQGYKSGQMVLVEGHLAELDASGKSPAYQVRHVWQVKQ